MIAAWHRCKSTLSLVARHPVRLAAAPDFTRSDFWLPVTGLLPGASAMIAFFLAKFLFGSVSVAAFLAILVQYLLYNLFHFDGLADTADAFGPPGITRERRLEILKDSRSGAFAVFAGFITLVIKGCAIAAIGTHDVPGTRMPAYALAFIIAPIAGRGAAALVPTFAQPAREGGLGSLTKGFKARRAIAGIAAGMAVPSAILPLAMFAGGTDMGVPLRAAIAIVGAFALATTVALAIAALTGHLYKRGMGGYTGDALGFAVEVAELAILLLVLAVLNLGVNRFF